MFGRSKKPADAPRQPLRSVTPKRPVDVFSYHAARQVRDEAVGRKPEQMQERERVGAGAGRRRVKAVIAVVLCLLLLGFMTWLSDNPQVVVLGSNTDRALLQNTSVYQHAAAKLMSSSFTNHNKLTLDTNGIATSLEREFPELLSVSVQPPVLGTKPQIYVQPAAPALLMATASGSEFVVAVSGKALAPAGQAASIESLNLPLVTDQSGLVIQTGKSALPDTDVTFVQIVTQQLQAHHIAFTSLILPRGTSELDVHLSGKPYFIKFNLEDDASQQVGTFLAVNSYLGSHNITPAQYIDVRVLGRAYYK